MRFPWIRKIFLRLALLAALLLLMAFAAFYFLPVSSSILDRKIERALSRALDMKVGFDSAQVHLAGGRITLDNVRLASPEKPGAVIEKIPRADASVPILKLLFSKQIVFKRIRIHNPSRIQLVVSGTRISSPQLDRIVEKLSARRKSKAPSTVFAKEWDIRNGALQIISAETSQTLVRLQRCNLTYSHGLNGHTGISLNAKSIEPPGASLKGFVEISDSENYAHFEISVDHLNWISPRRDKPMALRCSHATVRADVFDYSLSMPQFSGALTLKGASFESGTGYDLPYDKQITVEVAGQANRNARLLHLRRLELYLPQGWLRSSGKISISPPYEFALALEKARIPQFLIDEISSRLQEKNIELKLPGSEITAQGKIEGTLLAPAESLFEAHALFRNASLRSSGLKRSFDNIRGEIQLNNNALLARGVRGNFGQAQIIVDARLSGEPIFTRPDQIEVLWTINTPAEDLPKLAHVEAATGLSNLQLTGNIHAQGRTNVTLTTPMSTDTDGTVDLINISINHPSLPEPLRDISGRMNLQKDKLESENLSGKLFGIDFNLAGTLEGRQYFWERPRTTATMTAKPGTETIRNIIRSRYPKIRIPPIEGETTIQLNYAGDLDSFNLSEVSASIIPHNVEILVKHLPLERKLILLTGEVRYERGNFIIKSLHGMVGKNAFTLSAETENEQLRVVANSTTRLEHLKESLPEILATFRASGEADIRATARLSRLSNIKWNQIGAANAKLSDLLKEIDFLITIEAKKAAFSHIDMPEEVTDIEGTFIITKNGLSVNGASSRWGKSRQCLVDGTVQIEDDIPTIRFRLQSPHAILDDWLVDWKRAPRPPIRTITRFENLKIFGDIVAENASYKGLNGKNLLWDVEYTKTKDEKQVDFKQIVFEAYEGTGKIGGSIVSTPDRRKMDLNVKIDSMNMQHLLADRSGRDSSASGFIGGEMTLHSEAKGLDHLTGNGQFVIKRSRFVRNVVFEALGRLLRTKMFDDISFSTVDGKFSLSKQTINFDRLVFQSSVLEMNARGKAMLDGSVDAYLYIVFLRERLHKIPILGNIMSTIGKLGRRIIKFHLTGTLNKPRISPIPLSIDEIDRFLRPKKND